MNAHQELQSLLLREWSSGLRLTTIPQAMERLDVKDSLRLRWRLGKHLESLWRGVLTSPEKRQEIAAALGRDVDEANAERWRQQVAGWGLASILLTENEKLVARALLLRHREGLPLPQPADIARMVGLPVSGAVGAVRMLARLGLLSIPERKRPFNYSLAQDHARFLEGLGFFFHTITLDTGERFGVP